MVSNLKVSICIPAYNNGKSLQRLLHSIFEQNFKDYEIIITDDSTTTEVEEIVKSYDEYNINYEKNADRLGATANCNAAIKKAQGEYIKVMHHDDWFTGEESLQNMVNLLDNNSQADIAFCGSCQVSEHDKFDRCITNEQVKRLSQSAEYPFIENCIGAPSATIWRNKAYYFDPQLVWLVDIELYIRILRDSKVQFAYTTEPLVSIGISGTQVTESCLQNHSLLFEENVYVYRKLSLYKQRKCKDALYKIFRKKNITKEEYNKTGLSYLDYEIFVFKERISDKLNKIVAGD